MALNHGDVGGNERHTGSERGRRQLRKGACRSIVLALLRNPSHVQNAIALNQLFSVLLQPVVLPALLSRHACLQAGAGLLTQVVGEQTVTWRLAIQGKACMQGRHLGIQQGRSAPPVAQQGLMPTKGTEQLLSDPSKRIIAEQSQMLPSQLMQALQAWQQALLQQSTRNIYTAFQCLFWLKLDLQAKSVGTEPSINDHATMDLW